MEYKLITEVGFYGETYIIKQLTDVMNHAKIELEHQLTNAIYEGWTPQGGVSVTVTECSIILAQAVIK